MEDSNRNFKLQTCEDFIEVLASKAAVPGGGGAAALTGAIGIALGNMVGSLTVGKKTYADVEDEIIECKKEADEIAKEFLELMDKDGKKSGNHPEIYKCSSERNGIRPESYAGRDCRKRRDHGECTECGMWCSDRDHEDLCQRH